MNKTGSITKPSTLLKKVAVKSKDKKKHGFFKSQYERRAGDFYPTIDTRAVDAMLYHFIGTHDVCVDMCAPQGSAIVDYLNDKGIRTFGLGDAFAPREDFQEATWGITNTPYLKSQVDKILERQIARVRNYELKGFAALLRTQFDHAYSRRYLFEDESCYYGQIKICARLWWTDDRDQSPMYDYVWHIWKPKRMTSGVPGVLYYYPSFDPRYDSPKSRKKKQS